MMTSKEIAMGAIQDITCTCNTALGYWAWQRKAEQMVSSAFSAARNNRKMVTAVADEIVKQSFATSQRFGECMCMAVGAVLADWLRLNMLRGYEVQRARKMLEE